MKKAIIVFALILVVAAGIVGFFVAKHFTHVTPDTAAVVKEVRALNRWETASFTIEKVIDAGNGGNVFQRFFFGNRILLIAHGEVIGGFDLSSISGKDISVNGTSVTVTLPAPQVLFTRIDNAKTRVYDRQQGLLVPSNNDLESQALESAQKAIQDAACSEGILPQTSTNAKTELTSLLQSLGFTSVTITIPSGHC